MQVQGMLGSSPDELSRIGLFYLTVTLCWYTDAKPSSGVQMHAFAGMSGGDQSGIE